LGLAIFAYVRKELFFQQAKKLIRQNLERNFPCKLSIGSLRAGLFYGLVLEDLEISFAQVSATGFKIKVAQAYAASYKDVHKLRLIAPEIILSYPLEIGQFFNSGNSQLNYPQKDFLLVLEDGRISFGQASPLLKNLSGKIVLSKNGISFQDFQVTFPRHKGNIMKFYGELSANNFSFVAHLEHIKIGKFDLLTNLALTCSRKLDFSDQRQKLGGTLKTYGSVLNHRPFPELNSSFEIQEGKLRVLSFTLGDNYDLRGIVNLSAPYNADLSLNFHQAELNEILHKFKPPLEEDRKISSSKQIDFSGLVNGLIKITGPLNKPEVQGYLEVQDGHLGDLEFVSADINIKGRYPRILIVDSPIRREEDFFIMEGEIDFTASGWQNSLELKFKAEKGMLWQGWDITRRRQNQVHMSKNITDDFKVTFDMHDEIRGFADDNSQNELGLEYKVFGDKLLKLRLKKEEEVLGVEQRFKF
jgi:hypothetical protein